MRHPNLLDVYELGEVHGELFIAMEWVNGPSLRAVLRADTRPPPSVVVALGRALSEGLEAAHTLAVQGQTVGLVHRDLKPSNILLSERGSVKIADFGMAHIALRASGESRLQGSGGSPGYMSPEQWSNSPFDRRSDLFALGAVLAEIVTGRSLFKNSQRQVRGVETLLDTTGVLEEAERAVPGLSDVVIKLLQVDPAKRFQTAGELAEWFRVAAHTVPREPEIAEWLREVSTPGSVTVEGAAQTFYGLDERGPPDAGRPLDQTPQLPRTNQSEEPNAFVGREHALVALSSFLDQGKRLVTVLGPPGSGKTRLVKRFGSNWLLSSVERSVWFCDLSVAETAVDVVEAVSRALSLTVKSKESSDEALIHQVGVVIAGLGDVLLLLDNAEQVVDGLNRCVLAWWGQAPKARILVTSRVPLKVEHEQRFVLEPLVLPDPEMTDLEGHASNPAVALFVDRATRVRPNFSLSDSNVEDVVAICHEVDGLPLAIELAAAWIRIWPPRTLRVRLADRFKLLTRTGNSGEQRQATLRGAIDWSWALLQPSEQSALAQCSVFRGGFSWEAAEAVIDLVDEPDAPWVVDVVGALVEHNLLAVTEQDDGSSRLSMLISITEYAAEQLDQMGPDARRQAQRRHAAYFSNWREEGTPKKHRMPRRLQEKGNFVRACQQALAYEWPELAFESGVRVMHLLKDYGPYGEAIRLATTLLNLPLSDEQRERLFTSLGWFYHQAGQPEKAMVEYDKALVLAREFSSPVRQVHILTLMGLTQSIFGSAEEAIVVLERALELAQSLPGVSHTFRVKHNLAVAQAQLDRLSEAKKNYEEVLSWCQDSGRQNQECGVRLDLGNVEINLGNVNAAVEHYRTTLAIAVALGLKQYEAVARGHLGTCYSRIGQSVEAIRYFRHAAQLHRRVGNRRFEAIVLGNLGKELNLMGETDEGMRCLRSALAVQEELGNLRSAAIVLVNLGSAYAEAGEVDRALATVERAVSYARQIKAPRLEGLFLTILGEILIRHGNPALAGPHLNDAETCVRSVGDRGTLGILFAFKAQLAWLSGDVEEGKRLLASAVSIHEELNLGPDSELGCTIASVEQEFEASG